MKPIHLFLAFALLIAAGCKDNLDPSQQILGKWQEIARGNEMFPEFDFESDGHIIEFLPDGTYHAVFGNGTITTRRYRTDAEFLYLDSGTSPDGHTYRYTFSGTDKLRLDYVDGLITLEYPGVKFRIFKQLKNK